MMIMPVVLAQTSEVEETPLSQFFAEITKVIPPAFVIAFASCFLGYLKSTPPEKFELDQFIATLILSVIVGIITVETGWDYATIEAWLGNAGLTVWIYWIAKIIAIRLKWVVTQQTTAETTPSTT